MKSYHDFLEAAYHAGYQVLDQATGRMKRGLAYKNDRAGMAGLAEKTSYHFGHLQDVSAALNLQNKITDHADAPEGEHLFSKVNEHLDVLGLDNVALVYEDRANEITVVVITCFDFMMSYFMVAVHAPASGWVMIDGASLTRNSGVFMRLVAESLEMLANPSVQFVMRDPTKGMETFSKNRVRRGEEPVADMKIVHLTKRIYIGGKAIGGHAGSHAEKSPHDRKGHWRHSERQIVGWEEVKPKSGQYAGVTMWRKWINTFAVNGGARKRHQIADNAAPQFKVVR